MFVKPLLELHLHLKTLKCLFVSTNYDHNYYFYLNFEKHTQEVILVKHGFYAMVANMRIIKFNIKFSFNLLMLIGSLN